MKIKNLIGAILVAALGLGGGIAIADGSVKALREMSVDSTNIVDEIHKQDTRRFVRNYRQQPPLIPHSIDQHQIDLRTNECLACHDWTNAGDRGAPTLSMTHYLDREGEQLDRVAGTRWFCNQCHVPQVNAPALVNNEFTPSN